MIFEFFAVASISKPYVIAAFVAALVRILILLKQPPPPRPTAVEMGRQALITFIFVAVAEPLAAIINISEEFATLGGVAVALHGTDRVVEYVKSMVKVFLPEKLKAAFEQVEDDMKLKEAERTNADQLKRIEHKKKHDDSINTNRDNENT